MRLKVGDIILDQFKDTIIAQNYEVNTFGDISTRNGGFTNDFKLPLTAKNSEALGFPADLNISTREPYEKVDAQLIDVGSVIAIGYLRYKVVEDDTLKCSFFSENTEWFNLLKDKKLVDLDLSDYDHEWIVDNIVEALDGADGYVYPLIDYGEFEDVTTLFDFIYVIDSDSLFPGIMISKLVDQIFIDIGWSIEGELTTDPLYLQLVQPFSAKDFVKGEAHVAENTVQHDELNTPDLVKPTELPTPIIQEIQWDNGSGDINVPINDTYGWLFILNVTFTGTISSTLPFMSVHLMINGIEHTFLTFGDQYTSGVPFDIVWQSASMSLTIYDDVSFDFHADRGAIGTFVFNSGNVTIFPINQYLYGDVISMSTTMPDITQIDFLKYIFFTFGIIPQPNNYSKTVSLDFFKSIKDNINVSIDWSAKLDVSKKRSLDFTQLLSEYSRKSRLTYLEDDNDEELKSYLAETSQIFGQGILDIDNEHLEPEKDIYEAPYSSMINIVSFDGEMYVPQIKWFDETSPGFFTKEFEPEPKIGILSTSLISITDLSNGEKTTIIIDPPTGPALAITSIGFTWFAKTQYITAIDALDWTLAYDEVLFPNNIGKGMIESYIEDYETALSEMKYVKDFFRLTETDINNLDFMIPIYVDHYKSYFYINKIKNYQGSNKSTEVELIRIGNG